MIKKIISIKNVGKFVDYSASDDVELRKLAIFYAENGRGKTMLSSIFRSLRDQDSQYIQGRKTLGTADFPQVLLRLDGINATFKNDKWDNALPDLEVFDSVFINENVFSGSYVDHEHKKNLYRFIVGKKGFQLAQKVDALDDKIRNNNSQTNAKEIEIQKHIIGSLPHNEFVSLSKIENIDKEIELKKSEIDVLKKANEIANKSSLARLSLPILPTEEIKKLLSKRLKDISEDAEMKTKEHIAQCMDNKGEVWISDGLSYIKADKCPFCGQSLAGIELITTYRGYFSTAYTELKEEIAELSGNIKELLSQTNILTLQKSIKSNDNLSEFWDGYIQTSFPKIDFNKTEDAWNNLRNLIDDHLTRKTASPLEVIKLSESLQQAFQSYEAVRTQVETYNQTVDTVNLLVGSKKQKTASGNLVLAENELERFKNTKSRFKPEVNQLCVEDQTLTKEKAVLEADKQNAKESLDSYTENIFSKYEVAINGYLEKFGAGFKICKTEWNYIGGKPSSSYQISINDKAVPLGDQETPDGVACFKNTLSDGDKSTLAFAFFLARLDQDLDIVKKIIVIDDPISSLDGYRKTCTQQQITRLSQLAKQVIVLSHDPYFLRSIWDSADKATTKALHIFRKGQDSAIALWDIERETQGEYFKNYFSLAEYLETGTARDLRTVTRCIRPLLEGNLRMRFPKEFKRNEWLGEMIERIRNSKTADTLFCLQPCLQEISDINEYSKRYHHDRNPSADSETITDGELQAYVKRTLKVIGGILTAQNTP